MKLLALGINHKTAPLEIRERTLFTRENTPEALRELLQAKAVNEAVILSTCNRTEVYTDCNNQELLAEWLALKHWSDNKALTPYLYSYQDEAAVRHLMRVAAGLDSMVLGEPQILGQLKDAVSLARESGTLGSKLHRLFQSVFAVGKEIRTQTGISNHPVSFASTISRLAKQIFADVTKKVVLLVGAGETIELVATYFYQHGIQHIIIANRSHEKAMQLAQKFSAQGIAMSDLPAYLNQADIVVTATTSQLPLIGKGMLESALKIRKHRPMLMVDLSVPRNIEPEVKQLEDIYLYHLDDLHTIISSNLQNREEAAKQAELLIATKAAHLSREWQASQFNDVIQNYRLHLENLAADSLEIALAEIRQGKNPEIVLQWLTHNLVQKILHKPTLQLRQAAYAGELDIVLALRRLLNNEINSRNEYDEKIMDN